MANVLSVFPDLLTYGLFAPLILRLTLGFILLYFALLKVTSDRASKIASFESLGMRPGNVFVSIVGGIELVTGLLLIFGLYTQVAALASAALMLAATIIKARRRDALPNDIEFYILLLAVSVSLLFLGAGFFAIDLPL